MPVTVQRTPSVMIPGPRLTIPGKLRILAAKVDGTPKADKQAPPSGDSNGVVFQNAIQAEWSPVMDRVFAQGQTSEPEQAQMPTPAEIELTKEKGLSQLTALFKEAGLTLNSRETTRFLEVYEDLTPQAKKGLASLAAQPGQFKTLAKALKTQLDKEDYQIQSTKALDLSAYNAGDPRKSASKPKTPLSPTVKQSLLRGYLDALIAPMGITQNEYAGKPGVVNGVPNFEHNDRIKFEVNHPEKPSELKGTMRIFSSSKLEKPIELDNSQNSSAEVYSYCDTSKLGTSRRPIYHAVVYTNTSAENIAVPIDVKGAAFTSNPKDVKDYLADAEGTTLSEKAVRAADTALQTAMLTGNYQTNQTRMLKPGESIVVWTALREEDVAGKESKQGNNVRSQYLVDVHDPVAMPGQTLPAGVRSQIRVDVYLSDSPQDLGIDPKSKELHGVAVLTPEQNASALNQLEAAPMVSSREIETDEVTHKSFEYLKRGTDFELLQSVYAAEYDKWQAQPEVNREAYLAKELADADKLYKAREGDLSKATNPQDIERLGAEVTYLEHRSFVLRNLDALRSRDEKNPYPGQLSSTEIDMYQDMVNNYRRGVRPAGSSDGQLLPLRRMSAAIKGNQASGVVPKLSTDRPGEYIFNMNSKYLSRGGSLDDQSAEVISPLIIGNRPTNVSARGHGNYGIEYSLILTVENKSDQPKAVKLYFSKSNERLTTDNGDAKPNFTDDRTGKEKGLRAFTGTVRILIPGEEPLEVSVSQGHIQNPQVLKALTLKSGETKNFNIQFVVPNNSTGPQLVHVDIQ